MMFPPGFNPAGTSSIWRIEGHQTVQDNLALAKEYRLFGSEANQAKVLQASELTVFLKAGASLSA
jgi:hypothetical protein